MDRRVKIVSTALLIAFPFIMGAIGYGLWRGWNNPSIHRYGNRIKEWFKNLIRLL